MSYLTEKFAVARRNLMIPHPRGEEEAIAAAFHECSLGLRHLNIDTLDDDTREMISELKELMDITDSGSFPAKARTLNLDQKFALRRIVDHLASLHGT